MQNFFMELLEAIIMVAVPIIAGFLVRLLHTATGKTKAATQSGIAKRYIDEAAGAVESAVLCVSQTYVDALKGGGAFSREKQAEALRRAGAEARALLSAEAKEFLTDAYGDLGKYLSTLIEAEVKVQKGEAFTLEKA